MGIISPPRSYTKSDTIDAYTRLQATSSVIDIIDAQGWVCVSSRDDRFTETMLSSWLSWAIVAGEYMNSPLRHDATLFSLFHNIGAMDVGESIHVVDENNA